MFTRDICVCVDGSKKKIQFSTLLPLAQVLRGPNPIRRLLPPWRLKRLTVLLQDLLACGFFHSLCHPKFWLSNDNTAFEYHHDVSVSKWRFAVNHVLTSTTFVGRYVICFRYDSGLSRYLSLSPVGCLVPLKATRLEHGCLGSCPVD